jgi:hypothetical protein
VAGKQQGPVAESALRAALQSLPPDTLVWREGMAGWKTAAEAGLAPPQFNAPPRFNAPPPATYGGFGRSAQSVQPAAGALQPATGGLRQSGPSAPASPAPAYGASSQNAPPAQAAAAPIRQAAPQSAPIAGQPTPPEMHWVLLLVLSWVTGGLAGVVWGFKQAAFVKKIDPANQAIPLLAASLVAMAIQVAVMLSAISSRSMSAMTSATGVAMLLNVVIVVVWVVAVFSMRTSIVRHYNSVEPIGLRLSGVMTLFFSVLYFQHHFSRIAAWKKTGRWG